MANGLKFYDLKKKLTAGVALTRAWGYIHEYYNSVIQVYWYLSQVSGERLQDHWSSGCSCMMMVCKGCSDCESEYATDMLVACFCLCL